MLNRDKHESTLPDSFCTEKEYSVKDMAPSAEVLAEMWTCYRFVPLLCQPALLPTPPISHSSHAHLHSQKYITVLSYRHLLSFVFARTAFPSFVVCLLVDECACCHTYTCPSPTRAPAHTFSYHTLAYAHSRTWKHHSINSLHSKKIKRRHLENVLNVLLNCWVESMYVTGENSTVLEA